MSKAKPQSVALVGGAVLLAMVQGGCSKPQNKAAGPPPHKGIYTTGIDCANSEKISFEDCSAAIERAVQEHVAHAPTYSELRFCQAKEGEGKCEAAGEGRFRAKLMAFFVTASVPPVAVPLYAHSKGEDGFRDLAGKTYMHDNEELVFSEHAQTMYERNSGKRYR